MTDQVKEFNKEYLTDKINAIGEKLGDAYGQPFMEELIVRMERTVAHFNDEVDTMVSTLKSRTKNQYNLLASMRGEDPNAEPVEMSDLEKKLESGESNYKGSGAKSGKEEKPKKKFSLFKRKKKK
ncbi:MAG: hypothetical protein U9N31_01155 [Candidatus Marinimicrobia bacterium]|nr:hypothetical protein [Candidatus Neomarinimicrobiota bacterium]